MKIGIDCDGVLRDLITCITDTVKETMVTILDR
jgi:hypothetical protein